MPKRRREETEEQRWQRKMKKYENKLSRRRRRGVLYSSDEDGGRFEEQPQEQELESTDVFYENPPQDTCVSPTHINLTLTEDAVTSNNDEVAECALQVDSELLLALGDNHVEAPEWGNDILPDVAQRWEPILKSGLTKNVKEDLFKKYLFPKNVVLSKPPVLNPEISAVLADAAKNRDQRLYTKQGQIGRSLAAIGQVMTGILTKQLEATEILKLLNDAGKLIADSHFLESDTRRILITPLLDKSYITALKDRPRDTFLFGENLGDFVKSSRGLKKTGQLITPPTSSASTSNNLNWKGPPRQQRYYRPPANRGGGGPKVPPARRPPAQTRRPPPLPRRPPPPPPLRPQPGSTRSRNTTT